MYTTVPQPVLRVGLRAYTGRTSISTPSRSGTEVMYETEEQQVEAIKKWWKDNGTSIFAGVALGLGGVLGWGAWVDHQDRVAGQASNVFEKLVSSVETENVESAASQVQVLHAEFLSTPYSTFADMMQARLLHEQGDAAGAEDALRRAIANAPDPALQAIAVLRLARILLSSGETDGAEAMLSQYPAPNAFAGEYAAVRGDIARSRGDVAAARDAYRQAITARAGNADLLQLKLENLPPAS